MVYKELLVSINHVPQLQLMELHTLQHLHVKDINQDVLLIIIWMDAWIYHQHVQPDKSQIIVKLKVVQIENVNGIQQEQDHVLISNVKMLTLSH